MLNQSKLNFIVEDEIGNKINELSAKYDNTEDLQNISVEDAIELKYSLDNWERVLKKELIDVPQYTPTESSLLNIKELLNSPDILFEDMGIWDELPKQVKEDLSQAVRALAFNCPTGSVFLALRAVENRLREWYGNETGRDIEDRTFGEVIGELDDQYDESDQPPILIHLNYLKVRRNEVAHPDRSPSLKEAESTLINVRETIFEI